MSSDAIPGPDGPSIPDELLEHVDWLRALAHRLVSDESRAEDCLQDTWLATLRWPPRPGVGETSWLRRVLKSQVFRKAREERRRRAREEATARPEGSSMGPEQIVEQAEQRQLLARNVLGLPETLREVVLLHFYGELGLAEVARRQGVDPRTARRRLASALSLLRKQMDGGDEVDGGQVRSSAALLSTLGSSAGLGTKATISGKLLNGTLGGGILMSKTLMTSATVAVLSLAVGFGLGRQEFQGAELAPSPESGELLAELEGLRSREAELRREISELRQASARRLPSNPASGASAPDDAQPSWTKAPGTTPGRRGVSFEEFRDWVVKGDFQNLGKFLEEEDLERTLEKRGRPASYLVAASLLTQDRERAIAYLEEALERDPDSSAALLRATQLLINEDGLDEHAKSFLEDFQASDGANSLGNYYDALYHLRRGESREALKALQAASLASHLEDYSLQHLPLVEEFYLDATGSNSMARALGLLTTRLDSLGHLRELSRRASEEIRSRIDQGNSREALTIARSLTRMGNRMSSTSRTLVQDLVALKLESAALESERVLHQEVGEEQQVARIEDRIARLHQLEVEYGGLVEALPSVLSRLDEAAFTRYFDRVSRQGEAAATRALVAEQEEN